MTKLEKRRIRVQIEKHIHNCEKRIAIYPYGAYGQYAAEYIKLKYHISPICIDNYRGGKDVVSLEIFLDQYRSIGMKILIVTAKKCIRDTLVAELTDAGVSMDDIIFFDIDIFGRRKNRHGCDLNQQRRFIKGKREVKSITKRHKHALCLFSLANIGDTIALAAFSSHVKRMYKAEKLVLICRENHKDIGEMFEAIDDCIPLSGEKINAIMQYAIKSHDYYGSNYIIGNYPLFDHTYDYFSQRTIQFKSLILQIPESCPVDPINPEFSRKNDSNSAKEWKDAVILSPYANSLALLDWGMWYHLSEGLKGKGYRVYTNVYGKEREIRGTERFEKGLRETFNICQYCRAVISYRSGFSDFMAFNHEIKHIVISPNEFEVSFSNVDVYGSDKITNLIWNNDEDELIERVLKTIE